MSDEHPTTADRYEWERIVRRVVMPSPVKLVALMLATYADRDGSRVYPGVARLVAVTGLSERSVRNGLKQLREIGLIERVFKGGHRGTMSLTDVHRLAIPVELLDRVELLPASEEAVPKRQEVPVGEDPNRHLTTPQPAGGASQPAPDDTPTGRRCTPPVSTTTHKPTQQPNDDSLLVTELQNAQGDSSAKVVALNGWGGRR